MHGFLPKGFPALLNNNKIVAALLIAACFFVYANSLNNNFVWDDEEQVVNNTIIRDWNNLPLAFTSSTFYAGGAGLSGGFYRPLVTLSYFWNYMYWGLNPFGYHLMQLFFHCVNSFLVFCLLKLIFEKNNLSASRPAAIAAALVFAIHPANVESVAYIGSIGEVIYAFFSLLSLIFFCISLDNAVKYYSWAAFISLFFGLLAKESAIIILPLMLAYALLLARPCRRFYINFAVGAALIIIFYSFLRFKIAGIQAVSGYYAPIHLAPLWQRFLTLPYEVVSYLGIIFFPRYLSISRHFVVASASDPKFWVSLVALLIIFFLLAFYAVNSRSKISLFFILWFVIALAPVLNIIPLDMTMAERWLYFPVIGLFAFLSFTIVARLQKIPWAKQKIALSIFMVVIILLSARTIARNIDWRNGLSLYSHDIAIAPKISPSGSFDLENNYGVELFRARRFDEAEAHFRKSIELQSQWASSQNNLGAVLEYRGDLEGALAQYKIAARMNYYLAFENVAQILFRNKKYSEAINFLEESLTKLPNNEKLQYYLALIYSADNIGNNGESKQKAAYLLEQIIRADPQNKQAQYIYYMLQTGQPINI